MRTGLTSPEPRTFYVCALEKKTCLDPVSHAARAANAVKPPEAVLGPLERAAAATGDADVGGWPRPQRRRAEGSHPYGGGVRGSDNPEEVRHSVFHGLYWIPHQPRGWGRDMLICCLPQSFGR